MFDYTKTAIDKTISDVKIGKFICDITIHLLYIVYLVYAVSTQRGTIWINVTLLSLSSVYFVFLLALKMPNAAKNEPKIIRICSNIYKYSKYALKICVITIALIDITVNSTAATPTSILLTSLIIVGFALQIVFEIISAVVISRFNFMKEAINTDVENMMKPIRAIQNLAKRITGQEIAVEDEPSKNRRILDEMVAERKAQKKTLRAERSIINKVKGLFSKRQDESCADERIEETSNN